MQGCVAHTMRFIPNLYIHKALIVWERKLTQGNNNAPTTKPACFDPCVKLKFCRSRNATQSLVFVDLLCESLFWILIWFRSSRKLYSKRGPHVLAAIHAPTSHVHWQTRAVFRKEGMCATTWWLKASTMLNSIQRSFCGKIAAEIHFVGRLYVWFTSFSERKCIWRFINFSFQTPVSKHHESV